MLLDLLATTQSRSWSQFEKNDELTPSIQRSQSPYPTKYTVQSNKSTVDSGDTGVNDDDSESAVVVAYYRYHCHHCHPCNLCSWRLNFAYHNPEKYIKS